MREQGAGDGAEGTREMSDRTSQGLASDVFTALGKGFAKQPPDVQKDRRKLAKMMIGYFEHCDFCIEDCGVDDELIALGLAKKCKTCKGGRPARRRRPSRRGRVRLVISFAVEGRPATKGSWRPIVRNGKARLIPQLKRSKPWQDAVAWGARAQMRGRPPTDADVEVTIAFVFKRPKKTKLRRPRGDLDKLARAAFDAMSQIVYADDDAVVSSSLTKAWGEWDGAVITVTDERSAQ